MAKYLFMGYYTDVGLDGLIREGGSMRREAVEKAIETSGTIEMAFLERGLVALSSVANVAPLLGFLGTVSGMISAFEAIANADNVNAKLVASGISEALITTASGLNNWILAGDSDKSYEQLYERHVDDYSKLFGRVTISLRGTGTNESLPTDERISGVT